MKLIIIYYTKSHSGISHILTSGLNSSRNHAICVVEDVHGSYVRAPVSVM